MKPRAAKANRIGKCLAWIGGLGAVLSIAALHHWPALERRWVGTLVMLAPLFVVIKSLELVTWANGYTARDREAE